ncbi:serine hydrolase domain-containing protein [Roseivirga sp.]|uniref:serine hydrolase domain-containing protein n=1 Tax=Roseivirga sp. TaxID=1964215 RepID=UPI003B5207A5
MFKQHLFRNFLMLIGLGLVSLCQAQNQKITTLDGQKLKPEYLTNQLEAIIEKVGIPGISLAIINNNEVVYHEALGITNTETKEQVDKQSIFEAASLSKPIFAYFVMKMVEQGKLDLDKPLYQYLPHPGITENSKEDAKLITARMVLAHQTGFPNHSNGEPIELAFKPGTDFMYSGEAYQYLAAIVGMQNEVGWKKDLNALFQKEVTQPLKMPHSTFVWDDYLAAHKVSGHNEDGSPNPNHPRPGYWDGETFNSYSSLHTEAQEYARFIIAMLRKEGLKESTFETMLAEETVFSEDNPLRQQVGQTGWGLGFAQKKGPDHTMHLHTGNNHDFQAYAMFVPEKDYGLVVFVNTGKMIPFLEELYKVIGPQF